MHGKMAERSKACDSSESLPANAGFSSGYPGVGSNPTRTILLFFVLSDKLHNGILSTKTFVEADDS